jgi:16S rRNA G966 N2-methylase RsmD
MANNLYYGDNLSYLREFDRELVDLIYLDPPFNSKATYNLLFRDYIVDIIAASGYLNERQAGDPPHNFPCHLGILGR